MRMIVLKHLDNNLETTNHGQRDRRLLISTPFMYENVLQTKWRKSYSSVPSELFIQLKWATRPWKKMRGKTDHLINYFVAVVAIWENNCPGTLRLRVWSHHTSVLQVFASLLKPEWWKNSSMCCLRWYNLQLATDAAISLFLFDLIWPIGQ